MNTQGAEKRGGDEVPGQLGSSVDSPGSHPPMSAGRRASGGEGGDAARQAYYCSPPYFSSSASSSSSSSPESETRNPCGGLALVASASSTEYRGRAKSGSTSTPLTPQEFELLSDSNPFKQDIAEKYGIAYPGITTRAHSSEFIGQSERQSQSENEAGEFSGLQRKKRSASVNDSVDSFTLDISSWKASSEKISTMCRGLNAFLLKNQESIEQSIASLDDTDVVIPTSEGAGVFSAPKKYDIVYVGKQNSSEEINSPVNDISPERLLDADLTEIQLEGKRDSTSNPDTERDSDPHQIDFQKMAMLSRPSKQVLEQTRSDPYSAIKFEDKHRKKTSTKIFSGAQTGLGESEDDQLSIKPLSTRSFEECALKEPSNNKTVDENVLAETKTSSLQTREPTDNTSQSGSHSSQQEENTRVSPKSTFLTTQEPSNISVRTISNLKTGTHTVDSGRNNRDGSDNSSRDPFSDSKVKDNVKTSKELSPPHEILAAFDPYASIDKAEKREVDHIDIDGQSTVTQASSSFYSVFSTTVSSLEDVDAELKTVEKAEASPDHQPSYKSDSTTWDAGDSTPGADSVFSAKNDFGYERSVSEGSQSRKESSGYYAGEIMVRTKSKVSEDSGDSSKESASRDSMRVNLSQGSSMADPHDEPSSISSTYQMNGFPENEELTTSPRVMNVVPRLEIGVPQRHLDLASMLLPMAESASTDSMFVHVSTDSLHSAGSERSSESFGGGHELEAAEQRKLSDKSSRAQLCIDLRRKNLMEQSRRRSLPPSQLKGNLEHGKATPPVLCSSHSLDSAGVPDQPLQRRSSVPTSRPKSDSIKVVKCSGSTSAPRLQYGEAYERAGKGKPAFDAVSKRGKDTSRDMSQLQPTSPPQATSPSTARPRPSSKRGSVSSEKNNPNSIDLGQVVNILAGTTVATTIPTTTKVKVQKPQRTKIQFTIAAKPPEPATAKRVASSESGPFSKAISPIKPPSSSPPKHPPPSHQAAAEQGSDTPGFLQERKEELGNVNIVVPPDLVPYEETFSSPMQSVPESSLSTSEEKTDAAGTQPLEAIPISETSKLNPAQESMQDGQNSSNEIKPSSNTREEEDNVGCKEDNTSSTASQSKDKDIPTKGSITKSSSASDSDGGDIDTIVQEFKEDNSDEGDIDDLVKEFIVEHPEAAVAAPAPQAEPGPEMTRQHSVGFNKLGRVLNKMQSVTKYMTKKKAGEEERKSPPMSRKGRRSRTNSQNESGEVSSDIAIGPAQPQTENKSQAQEEGKEGKEETDPFELLSKAADVFKAQTTNKKKSPRHKTARVWRSMTTDSDVADLEGNDDCDLVTRAAILFKGFKGKKLQREGEAKTMAETFESHAEEKENEADPESSKTEDTRHGDAHKSEDILHDDSALCKDDRSEQRTHTIDQQQSIGSNENNTNASIGPSDDLENESSALGATAAPTGTEIDTDINNDIDESISKMGDSGFESSIRYATESSVKSDGEDGDDDDTDGPGKVSRLLDSAREHAVFSVIEVTTPELSTYENVTSKLGASIEKSVNTPELTLIEKSIVKGFDKTCFNRPKQDIVTGDGIILNQVEWPESKAEHKDDPNNVLGAETKTKDENVETRKKDETRMVASGPTDDHSAATDSGLEIEPRSAAFVLEEVEAKSSRPVSQTCDLILSTGYDDTKHTKLQQSSSSEKVDNDVAAVASTPPADAREKTNGKLEELTKEILAVDAAGLEVTVTKPGVDKLSIKSPEYQRLSSDSSGQTDANSLTVNLPDSPENGMSLAGDSPFSLCCGANFKINLNCTAMVKKPERRPSKVVIENKRCVMTEEEKMFPLKVSSSSKEDFDKDNPPKSDEEERQASNENASSSNSDGNHLKVNEHERNRNFAGSREELANDKKGVEERKAGNKNSKHQDRESKPLTSETSQKRRSLVEDIVKDKQAVNNYESVLHELSKKQIRRDNDAAPGIEQKEKDATKNERKERSRVKRYGRVISESELDGGLLPLEQNSSGNYCENQNVEKEKEIEKQVTANVPFTEGTRDQFTQDCTEPNVVVSKSVLLQDAVVTSEPVGQSNLIMHQSMDIYDNMKLYGNESKSKPDEPPPLPARDPRWHRPEVGHYLMHPGGTGNSQNVASGGCRYHSGSVSSVVSDGSGGGREGIRADIYLKARRAHFAQPQGKTKWVSSTPHLPTVERGGGEITLPPPRGHRHNSFPHLHANSDLDVSEPPGHQYSYPYRTHHRGHSEGSASSFASESVCWGNYARASDLQPQDRVASYDDSESSTSGLYIPGGGGGIPAGCGRASTLSDVSDGYIFGDYSTVKDDIQGEESRGVIRPLDNQHQQTDRGFRFRHFPAAAEPHVHYENIEDMVVTTQPVGSWQRVSGPDIHSDNHYAVIGSSQEVRAGHTHRSRGQPRSGPSPAMSSVGVQMSGSPSLARHGSAIRVSNCASQTSLDSLIGLVSHDASDILEGLPVYEYTLGAGLESEDEHSECQSLSAVASTQCPDLGQPDVTRQTASLDRQQWINRKRKGWASAPPPVSCMAIDANGGTNQALRQEGAGGRGRNQQAQNRKKETRVTFSRDAVLTEVIDELRRSEAEEDQQNRRQENTGVVSNGRGLRDIASSTLTSIGGGVKEFARIINSPFHCCRSARAEPKPTPKVGGAVVL